MYQFDTRLAERVKLSVGGNKNNPNVIEALGFAAVVEVALGADNGIW